MSQGEKTEPSSSSDVSIVMDLPPRKSASGPTTREDASFLATTRKRLVEATQSVLETASRRLRSGNSMDATQGSSNSTSTMMSSQRSSSVSSVPGETELQSLMNVAEYEIHQDPYRGILSQQQSLETKTSITTPWNACEWGTLPPEPIQEDSELNDPQIVVRHVGNCACPSLKEWTRLQLSTKTATQRKRKRPIPVTRLFQLGVRPEGDRFVCPCDYNPLCLATLGGVMNEVIEERCRSLNAALPSNPINSTSWKRVADQSGKIGSDDDIEVLSEPPSHSEKPSDVEIMDVATMIPSDGTTKVLVRVDDSSDSVDTFAFLEDKPPNPTDQKQLMAGTTPLLEANSDHLPQGDPAEIFFSSTVAQQDLSCITFSQKTNQSFQRARQSVEVDTASIRSYVHRKLQVEPSASDDNLSIDRYIKILKDWHERLQFINPIVDEQALSSDRISLAMPPGIRNLGATCYLNTQLQCLAQNLTFLNGIFSWRMADANHKMNSVMAKLQLLLAQIFLGGQCKVTTLDFSNALGLEHNEQQDPNEFARLLFDRMDESFQQCDNDGDLSNLLNKIFHGVTTYETICMTCGTSSERSEGFMDLNLPIVKPQKELKKKGGTILEAFAASSEKNVDTDVQYCFDQYTCAEMLDGENQYFCSNCNCKRDAKRILKLTELPPVLNIQLSRYVFDRTKFVKKKISDKVLLPTSLNVQTGGVSKKKYLLCAVMKHQGNSAYSGHYLAEAMDWLTGKWFEFNDETVKLLPNGPTSSFDPDILSAKIGDQGCAPKATTTKSMPAGSQDAYNMYYVEDGYLAKSAKAAILSREQHCKLGLHDGGVLDEINQDRKDEFVRLSELCIADAEVSNRLNRRKLGIRKYMLPNAQALVRSKCEDKEIGVWVSTDFLKRYLQCHVDTELDLLLESTNPVLNNSTFLCEHERISPKTARTGKLLPIPFYNALIRLLQGERALLQQESDPSIMAKYRIDECPITPSSNLICKECSVRHRSQLSRKLDYLRTAKDLYDALDTKKDDAALYYDESNKPKSDEEMYVYVVSKLTATKFRRRVAAVIKNVARYDGGGTLDEDSSTKQTSIYEGLSALDVSALTETVLYDDLCTTHADSIDRLFNSNVTCSHGNFNSVSNGRHIRYVTPTVWRLVKKLFPEAIEHKRRRESRNCQFYSDQDCPVCREERESVDTLKHAIQSWASTTREDPALKTLLDRKRTQAREHEAYNFTTATNGCRLVHKTDIITWREAVKTLANPQKIIGNSSDQIRSFSENLVFPSCHKVVLEFENEPIDKLVASIRSFICREHDLVVENAILGKVASSGSNEVQKLASYVTVVTKDEYHSYITSLATLLRILRTDVGQKSSSIMSPMALDQEESFIGYVRQVASSHHPLIRTLSEVGRTGKNSLKFIHDGSVKEFHLSPPMCDHETCVKECALLVVVEDKDNNDDHIENISVDSFDDKPSARKAVASLGSGNSDPIVVESDAEDSKKTATFLMRVFELEAGATQDQAMEALHNASVISSDIAASSELRRSTRKRKPKFPFGVLLREDSVNVSLHHNVAAICLFMYESCGIPANYSKLFLVLTPEFEKSSISETSPFDSESQVSLSELIQRMRGGKLDDEHFDHKKHTLLLHQRDPGDSNCQHEALVEALFQCSNIDGDHASLNRNEDGVGSRKKSRPSERGFQGTLLQSGNPPSASTEHGDDDSVIQGHPEAPAISEDEHQEPTIVVDDSSPPASRSSSRPSNAVRNQMILSDDSDEDSVSKSPPTSGVDIEDEPTKELMTIVDTSDTERENASARDKLSVDTFSSLKAIVRRPNATKIWDAVLWAFSQNPTVNDASVLLDIAYAKYLSNSESA